MCLTASSRPARAGLTLMELVVVLAILVALAGIVIPLMPGMLGRSEQAASATNMSEISKWVQTFEAASNRFPQDWDSLTDGTATPLIYLADATTKGPFSGTPALQMTALTASQASALTGAGINQVQLMKTTQPSGTDLTFNPYQNANKTTNAQLIASGVSVPTLTLPGQQQLRVGDGTTSAGTFVVFGLGDRASLVKSPLAPGLQDAPVVTYDAFTPDQKYGRYGVVFQIEGFDTAGNAITFKRARFVTACKLSQKLSTTNDAIKGYWDNVSTVNGS